jgi:hypothetical protein
LGDELIGEGVASAQNARKIEFDKLMAIGTTNQIGPKPFCERPR